MPTLLLLLALWPFGHASRTAHLNERHTLHYYTQRLAHIQQRRERRLRKCRGAYRASLIR